MEKVVIYLHGFLSSPQSQKAQLTQKFVNEHYPNLTFEIPLLDNYPAQAHGIIEEVVRCHPDKQYCFIGSSLGGYLSTYMAEKLGAKAVLINPAVKPYELLADYLGEHINPYSQQHFKLGNTHIDELVALDVPVLSAAENYWVLLQTGDETLDYRQAEHKYQGAKMTIEQGGDHSFQHFERFLPEIFRFLLQD